MNSRWSIVVAGPPASGKSTISGSLARLLGRPVVQFDSGRASRYGPFGYTDQRAEASYQAGGAAGLLDYESRFEVRALQRCLDSDPAAILDTGGGLLHQHQPGVEERLDRALADANVFVLVLPFAEDQHRCSETLVRRLRSRGEHHPATAEWLDRGGVEVISDLVATSLRYRERCSALVDTGHGNLHTAVTGEPEWKAALRGCLTPASDS